MGRRVWAHAYQYHEVSRRVSVDGGAERENPLFAKAATYVSSLLSLEEADASSMLSSSASPEKKTNGGLSLHLGPGHTARDAFQSARLVWTYRPARHRTTDDDEALVLRVHRHDRTRVLRSYLQAAARRISRRRDGAASARAAAVR
jgi:hypothetical protein